MLLTTRRGRPLGALSAATLVPAAFAGVDVAELLDEAELFAPSLAGDDGQPRPGARASRSPRPPAGWSRWSPTAPAWRDSASGPADAAHRRAGPAGDRGRQPAGRGHRPGRADRHLRRQPAAGRRARRRRRARRGGQRPARRALPRLAVRGRARGAPARRRPVPERSRPATADPRSPRHRPSSRARWRSSPLAPPTEPHRGAARSCSPDMPIIKYLPSRPSWTGRRRRRGPAAAAARRRSDHPVAFGWGHGSLHRGYHRAAHGGSFLQITGSVTGDVPVPGRVSRSAVCRRPGPPVTGRPRPATVARCCACI